MKNVTVTMEDDVADWARMEAARRTFRQLLAPAIVALLADLVGFITILLIPVQVVRTSRRLVFRLLAWNPWQAVFLRGFDHCATPLRD